MQLIDIIQPGNVGSLGDKIDINLAMLWGVSWHAGTFTRVIYGP